MEHIGTPDLLKAAQILTTTLARMKEQGARWQDFNDAAGALALLHVALALKEQNSMLDAQLGDLRGQLEAIYARLTKMTGVIGNGFDTIHKDLLR